ncbi:hypothetical protein ABDK56_03705 [Sphingomonas sp. ASV193]|uniref:hypothetical protein n=1 Tax=Sphingomonas sp. ASV193 TaxID=3144405 RepID=UPI0032E92274
MVSHGGQEIMGSNGQQDTISRLTNAIRVAALCCTALACNHSNQSNSQDSNTSSEAGTANAEYADTAITSFEKKALNDVSAIKKLANDNAAAQSLVSKAMQSSLFDPASATYLNLRTSASGDICGKVNAKNRFGAYVGYKDFVLLKRGGLYISDFNDGLDSTPNNSFALFYAWSCATVPERTAFYARVAPQSSELPTTQPDQTESEPDSVLDAPIAKETPSVPST